MQGANYKETNGIVVGPEISRLFAEIIFQAIDIRLESSLCPNLIAGRDYSIKRYVDDYHIFAKSEQTLDIIEERLSLCLLEYKLFLNSEKRHISARPFVTDISRVKRDASAIAFDLARRVRELSQAAEPPSARDLSAEIERKTRDLRFSLAGTTAGFHNVSGSIMWRLRSVCRNAVHMLSRSLNDEQRDCASRIVSSTFELAFYLTSMDFRVRTCFSLSLLLTLAHERLSTDTSEQAEWVQNFLFEELVLLIESKASVNNHASMELMNLVLLGSHVWQERFVTHRSIYRVIAELASAGLNYFAYITSKFSMLKAPNIYLSELSLLNKSIYNHLMSSEVSVYQDANSYFLMCDFISAPDTSDVEKAAVLTKAISSTLGKTPSPVLGPAALGEIAKLIGFIDWTGVRLQHTLKRKRLQSQKEY